MAGGIIILAGGKIILAGGKNILAGGKIINNGMIFFLFEPPPPFVGLLVNVGKLFWQVEKLSIMECEEFILSDWSPADNPIQSERANS